MEAPPKYLKRVAHINNPKRQTFAAMLTALDDGVGTVLAALEERKLTDNTLIFYNSDNGGPTPQTTSRNGPLRATKGHVFEGGIRVPMLMQWKGRIPAGQVYASPVITLDIVPTALAAAGAPALPAHETDGANLLPFIAGQQAQSTVPHEFLFWRFGGQRAVRSHDWKLVQLPNQPPALYDLSKDIGEEKNLADQEPERVKSLQAAFDKWNRELAEPLWKNSRKKKAKASR
jgi:arylsulfatase A-like enzyme